MKNLTQLLLTTFIFFLFSFNISAQKKGKIQFIGGITFNSEYLYEDIIQDKISTNFGLFGQIQLGKRFSTVTSINFGQRKYKGSPDNNTGWCGTGLSQEFMALTFIGYQERALTIDQLFKLHFNHRKASYFIGAGGLLKLPQHVQSLPYQESVRSNEILIASPDSDYLDRRFGFLYAAGIDYRCWGNILFSAQINLNVYDSEYLRERFYAHGRTETYNHNNINLKFSVGYIF